jgi:hypothetical protein
VPSIFEVHPYTQEEGNMTATLKNAVEMLRELSAPLLPPKNYSKLYSEVFHNMGELPVRFSSDMPTPMHITTDCCMDPASQSATIRSNKVERSVCHDALKA